MTSADPAVHLDAPALHPPRLVAVVGLPGTGKTTLAAALAGRLQAAYLRVDAIETALATTGEMAGAVELSGYAVARALAESNLRAGVSVVLDAVSPVPESRRWWYELAETTGATVWVFETHLPDVAEHERRVIERGPDLVGQVIPTWEQVRDWDYTPWDEKRDGRRLLVDTTEAAVALSEVVRALGSSDERDVLGPVTAGGRTFAVTRAMADDVPAIVRLLREDPLGAAREGVETEQYAASFAAVDADRAHTLLAVLDEAGSVVGTAHLTMLPGLSRGGAVRLQVEAVRVDATLRGSGLGSELFRWIIGYAEEHQAAVVQLTSDKTREGAHRFYERLGFVASHEGYKLVL